MTQGQWVIIITVYPAAQTRTPENGGEKTVSRLNFHQQAFVKIYKRGLN